MWESAVHKAKLFIHAYKQKYAGAINSYMRVTLMSNPWIKYHEQIYWIYSIAAALMKPRFDKIQSCCGDEADVHLARVERPRYGYRPQASRCVPAML